MTTNIFFLSLVWSTCINCISTKGKKCVMYFCVLQDDGLEHLLVMCNVFKSNNGELDGHSMVCLLAQKVLLLSNILPKSKGLCKQVALVEIEKKS